MPASVRRRDFFDFFPAPEFMLISTAGIALTDEGLKFAQLRRGLLGGQLKVAGLDKVESAETVSALKELSMRHNLRYVRAAFPDDKSYLFTAVIDKVPFEGLEDAVAFIIEENAPVSLAESVFAFETFDTADPAYLKVIVSVLPQKTVKEYIDLFKAAGITPISFEVESQAIARAIIPRGEMGIALVVNLEKGKTGFYVVEDGMVEFSTTLKHETLSASAPVMQELKGEMRKVFAFWDARAARLGQRGASRKIEKTLLCGSGAKDAAVIAALMGDAAVPYSLADAWINIHPASKSDWGTSSEDPFYYAPAVGLSLPRHVKGHV